MYTHKDIKNLSTYILNNTRYPIRAVIYNYLVHLSKQLYKNPEEFEDFELDDFVEDYEVFVYEQTA